MKIHANGGSVSYKTTGSFKYLPIQCYYNSESIANVLSLKSVTDIRGYEITMDSNNSPHIYVKCGNAKLLFRQSRLGLYYCIVDELKHFSEGTKPTSPSFTLLSSSDNRHNHSNIMKANNARNLQKAMMWPSTKVMKKLITHKFITDTRVKPEDFDIADDILGKSTEEIGGKMTAPTQSKDRSLQVLLHDIKLNIDRRVKLYIDIMYVCMYVCMWQIFYTQNLRRLITLQFISSQIGNSTLFQRNSRW